MVPLAYHCSTNDIGVVITDLELESQGGIHVAYAGDLRRGV